MKDAFWKPIYNIFTLTDKDPDPDWEIENVMIIYYLKWARVDTLGRSSVILYTEDNFFDIQLAVLHI